MKKKKQSFYKNKKRNQKWTEPDLGRPISFADKYAEGDSGSDKFNSKRQRSKNAAISAEKEQRLLKRLMIAVLCLALVSIGYIGADVHMIRHANPAESIERSDNEEGGISNISVEFNAIHIEGVSLDNSVMLSSIIDESLKNGYTAASFDAKRSDGTIGYASDLALIETYGAMSTPASKPKDSINELLANDILPIARISCYKDNVVPLLNSDLAVRKDGKIYEDSSGNKYLNPDNAAAYNYIRDIIGELKNFGISVFLLTDCDLPKEISKNYNDGFETLSSRLSNDLGSDIKLIKEVDVTVDGIEAESGNVNTAGIKNNIAKFPKLKSNQAYYINVKVDTKQVREQLSKSGLKAYVINE